MPPHPERREMTCEGFREQQAELARRRSPAGRDIGDLPPVPPPPPVPTEWAEIEALQREVMQWREAASLALTGIVDTPLTGYPPLTGPGRFLEDMGRLRDRWRQLAADQQTGRRVEDLMA